MTQRYAAALDTRARRANNVCPICWMPLGIGSIDDPATESWNTVQMAFKGKPAFGIRNPNGKGDVSRPVKAFGVCSLMDPNCKNYNLCHYVHFSMFGDKSDLTNLWYGCEFRGNPIRNNDAEPVKGALFFEGIVKERSIYRDAVNNDKFKAFMAGAAAEPGSNWGTVTVLAVKMFQFFSGCTDCNSNMTISKLIVKLFDASFPSSTYTPRTPAVAQPERNVYMFENRPKNPKRATRKKDEFDIEEMVHYLMLSGMLEIGDHRPVMKRDAQGRQIEDYNKKMFCVGREDDKKTWTLRYIMMWCAFQIVFCQWSIKFTSNMIKHHRNYIYYGTMDFYMSIWFFAMHCLKYGIREGGHDLLKYDRQAIERTFKMEADEPDDTIASSMGAYTITQPLDFEEFHYYYASVFPFYLKRTAGMHQHNNLSLSVFSLGAGPDFEASSSTLRGLDNPAELLQSVTNNVGVIYEKMFTAWDTHFSRLSGMIHSNFDTEDISYDARIGSFYSKPDNIIERRGQGANLPLDIAAFSTHLSSYWYWFHFKQITMPTIWRLCKEYDAKVLQSLIPDRKPAYTTGMTLWRSWYRQFDIRVKALGAGAGRPSVLRGLMELRAKMIAAKMNVGRS